MSRRASRAVHEHLRDILHAIDRISRAEARLMRAEAIQDAEGAQVVLDM